MPGTPRAGSSASIVGTARISERYKDVAVRKYTSDTDPNSTIWPADMMASSSQTLASMAMLWLS
jgi:hypothetical protein